MYYFLFMVYGKLPFRKIALQENCPTLKIRGTKIAPHMQVRGCSRIEELNWVKTQIKVYRKRLS